MSEKMFFKSIKYNFVYIMGYSDSPETVRLALICTSRIHYIDKLYIMSV